MKTEEKLDKFLKIILEVKDLLEMKEESSISLSKREKKFKRIIAILLLGIVELSELTQFLPKKEIESLKDLIKLK